ncbi:hypothetical protein Sjap_014449 [Stephania japonica]|uniref:EF-hand domain-containing protein n=1 Tax=Stephania japonica TaxID=461633 RepID=A0AAP0IJ64_9MAGN
MVKVSSVAIIYTAVALLLLFLISQNRPTNNSQNHHHHHRRLKLRSNFTFKAPQDHLRHDPIPFDPIIASIERRREDKQWEKQHYFKEESEAAAAQQQPEWEDFIDAEDYVNDEDRFNVTERLLLLFPKIDVDPVDGYVTESELTDWNLRTAEREVMHRTERDMDSHDKNRDGLVSFKEYEPPSWLLNSDNGSFGYDMGWWKEEHFNASDADGDGYLNKTEFNDFLHPADSSNPKLIKWLCREEVRERDTDKDGKLNFKEFFHGLFDLVRTYDDEDHNSSHHSNAAMERPAQTMFSQLDKDGDGLLSDVELLPIIGKLHPSERYYAKQQADYIISQADTNKDGRLSLAEMIENPYVFYSAIFTDEDEYEYGHDEFR